MKYFSGKYGFTFVETAMVVAIIGVLAAISFPGMMRSISHYRLNTASRGLVSDLRLARHLALKENRSIRINFPSQRSYQLERLVGENWNAVRDEVEFSDDHGRRGVLFSEIPEPIEFDYLGKADPPLSIGLLSETGESRTVEVYSSGRIVEY
jgi:prepilin-type N-terminal cleavage/methylation domain-containing protein